MRLPHFSSEILTKKNILLAGTDNKKFNLSANIQCEKNKRLAFSIFQKI